MKIVVSQPAESPAQQTVPDTAALQTVPFQTVEPVALQTAPDSLTTSGAVPLQTAPDGAGSSGAVASDAHAEGDLAPLVS
jgi:hypothetical protein